MISREINLEDSSLKICSRCIYDERVNGITFDDEGVCNYCRQIDQLKVDYGTGLAKGNESLQNLLAEIKKAEVQVCTRCIYDERVSAIRFDDDGICNYCKQVDDLVQQFCTGMPKGTEMLNSIVKDIKKAGKTYLMTRVEIIARKLKLLLK